MASTTVNPNNIMNTSSITSSTGGEIINDTRNHHGGGGGGGGSKIISPWTQIVRGDSSNAMITAATTVAREVVDEQPVMVVVGSSAAEDEGFDNGNGGNAGKRPAWNKPSNGAVEIGAVMGALSWPALSESARVSGKPSQQDLSKGSSDGSSSPVSVSQGSGSVSSSTQQKQVHNANPNYSTTPNHTMPARQRSMKRNGGANTSSPNGGTSQPSGSQQTQTGEVHLNNSSPRDHTSQRNSLSRSSNDYPQQQQQQQQQQQRNSFRRNGGPHMRGGSHHHNYGGRRDQDRPNQEWNNHRNFSGRDAHMQPQRAVARYMRHPPPPPPPPTTSTPFIGPPSMRAFGSPIGFHEIASPVYYVPGPPPDPLRAVPFVATPMPMYFPSIDPQLHSQIAAQIDYYFSNANLIKDTFLRQNMDDQGWVPITLIAGFKKVSCLTDNIQLILDAIRNSSQAVEVQGDKVRRRNDWERWVMPPSVQFPSASSPPGRSNQDMLAANVQSISLEENVISHSGGRSQADVDNEAFLGRSSSGDFNSQSQVLSLEGTGQVSAQGGSDLSTSTRNLSK